MADCEKLEKCPFFNAYKDDEKIWPLIKGFTVLYCKGSKQDDCVRKQISSKFGADKVPVNMMPNGKALPGTGKEQWDQKVIEFLS